MKLRAGTVLALLLLFVWTACKRRPPEDWSSPPPNPAGQSLPALALTDETADLLMTWVDARGDTHVSRKPVDVPMEGRDQVRVVLTAREEGARDLFYVANLTVKNQDGTYPVSTMARADWDAMIARRRQAFAAPQDEPTAVDPSSPSSKSPDTANQPPASFTVIVYGASWCGACHEAVAYLKKRRVPVVEKDIEQDPSAESEMRAKLARAGVHGGSIPVIDVKGKILIGFEPHALEAAVRGASAVRL